MENKTETKSGWRRNRTLVVTALMTVTLAVGMMIGTIISGHASATRMNSPSGATPLAIPDPVQLSSAFASIVKTVQPAVVNISSTQVIERKSPQRPPRSRGQQPDQQQPFQACFDRFFDFPDQGPQAEKSLGSGVIVDPKGFILTNNHVIDQATKIQVYLTSDQRTPLAAKVVGTDELTDLAVLKIDAGKDLPYAKLGNSDGVQVGDWVLAIGNPFGSLPGSVTAGIISAKDRTDLGQRFQRFLQTDAAINPGNSGGPLVNMAGQVIGINTAIITGRGGNEGVGFALPSNSAIGVYNQLIQNGKVVRGSIGVSFFEVDADNPVLLRQLGAPTGIVLNRVEPGGPGEKAGLEAGDVITDLNGQAVHKGQDFVDAIAQTPVGSQVHLTYVRDKKSHEAALTVGDRAKIYPDELASNDQTGGEPAPVEYGLHVEDFTADQARRAGITAHGVVVTSVDPASFAQDIGFSQGDLITEVNHTPVASVADYRRVISTMKSGQDILFKVIRRNENDQTMVVLLAGVVPSPEK